MFKYIISSLKNNKISYFLLLMIVLLIISLFFQRDAYEEQMELKVQFIEQKNMLRNELDDILDEHEDLLDEYGDLNEELYRKYHKYETPIIHRIQHHTPLLICGSFVWYWLELCRTYDCRKAGTSLSRSFDDELPLDKIFVSIDNDKSYESGDSVDTLLFLSSSSYGSLLLGPF